MNLICFSWEDWDLSAKRRSVPMVLAFLDAGIVERALYVNPPAVLTAVLRGRFPSKRRHILRYCWPREIDKVVVLTPVYPLPYRFRALNGMLARLQIRMAKFMFGITPFIYLNVHPQMTAVQPAFADAAIKALDMYDDFEQIVSADAQGRAESEQIRNAVDEAAAHSNFVVAVNATLAERFSKRGLKSVVLRNAVEFHTYEAARQSAAPPALRELKRPIIGYMGHANVRIDYALIKYLSDHRPDWSFVFLGSIIGKDTVPPNVLEAKNVHFVPAVPHDELPQYLTHFNVGIVPFLVTAHTRGNDPLKVYHYLAAGLPVVSTPVGGTELFGDLMHIGKSHADFLDQIEATLTDTGHSAVERRLAYARENSWQHRATEFAALIKSCP